MQRTRSSSKSTSTKPAHANGLLSTRIDIPKDKRVKLVGLLNQRLADTLDLYSQTKHAHWNVKGLAFHSLHVLFDEVAEGVEHHADRIAERATALGGIAHGTVRQTAKASNLPEVDYGAAEDAAVLESLCDRFAQHAEHTRESIEQCEEWGDKVSADLFTQLSGEVDKTLWLLEAHLQKAPTR